MVVGLQPHWENIEGGGMRGGGKKAVTPTLRSSCVPDSLLCTMEMQSTMTGPQPGQSSMQSLLQLTLRKKCRII